MKFFGNIIWLIFGGLHTAIEYFIAGTDTDDNHHWNPLGKDALPLGKAGLVTIRHGGHIAHEQRRETRIEA